MDDYRVITYGELLIGRLWGWLETIVLLGLFAAIFSYGAWLIAPEWTERQYTCLGVGHGYLVDLKQSEQMFGQRTELSADELADLCL